MAKYSRCIIEKSSPVASKFVSATPKLILPTKFCRSWGISRILLINRASIWFESRLLVHFIVSILYLNSFNNFWIYNLSDCHIQKQLFVINDSFHIIILNWYMLNSNFNWEILTLLFIRSNICTYHALLCLYIFIILIG